MKGKNKLRKIIYLLVCFSLFFQQAGFAQVAVELNIADHLAIMGNRLVDEKFRPLHLRYFSYDLSSDNFKFLFDKGDLKALDEAKFKQESQGLLKYFLIGITLPDSKFWVNLRPDSEEQIIEPELAQTDLGKVLLEADLQLKKDTARYTSPETPEGREYWNRLYKKAAELYGYEAVTIPTLTRPWIVPGEIIVRETQDSSFIYKSTLKVMLEEDYLKVQSSKSKFQSQDYTFKDERAKALNEYSTQLIRELIIPQLTREVNTSKKYAALRQVFYSLILSRWFKARFAAKRGQSPQGTDPFYVNLIDSGNLNGLTSQDSWSKTTYFEQYKKSFTDGEYNIKEPVYTPTGQVIRSYFSGGVLPIPTTEQLSGMTGRRAITNPNLIPSDNSAMPKLSGSPVLAIGKLSTVWQDEGLKLSAKEKAQIEDALTEILPAAFAPPLQFGHTGINIKYLLLCRIRGEDIFFTYELYKNTDYSPPFLLEGLLFGGSITASPPIINILGHVTSTIEDVSSPLAGSPVIVRVDEMAPPLYKMIDEAFGELYGPGAFTVVFLGREFGSSWQATFARSQDITSIIQSIIGRVKETERLGGLVKLSRNFRVFTITAASPVKSADYEKTAQELAEIIWQRLKVKYPLDIEILREGDSYFLLAGKLTKYIIEDNTTRTLLMTLVDLGFKLEPGGNVIFAGNTGLTVEKIKAVFLSKRSAGSPLIGYDGVRIEDIPGRIEELKRRITTLQERIKRIQADTDNKAREITGRQVQIPYQSPGSTLWQDQQKDKEQVQNNNAAISRIREEIVEILRELRRLNDTPKDKPAGSPVKVESSRDRFIDEFTKVVAELKRLEDQGASVEFEVLDDGGRITLVGPADGSKDGKLRNLMDRAEIILRIPAKDTPGHRFNFLPDTYTFGILKSKAGSSPMLNPGGIDGSTSSPSIPNRKTGGIDFRVMNIITQPLVASSILSLALPKVANLAEINLDEEFGQIQKMLAAGIAPSGERIKELMAASALKGEWDKRSADVISCLVDICRLEEDNVAETPLAIKEALIMADSAIQPS